MKRNGMCQPRLKEKKTQVTFRLNADFVREKDVPAMYFIGYEKIKLRAMHVGGNKTWPQDLKK